MTDGSLGLKGESLTALIFFKTIFNTYSWLSMLLGGGGGGLFWASFISEFYGIHVRSKVIQKALKGARLPPPPSGRKPAMNTKLCRCVQTVDSHSLTSMATLSGHHSLTNW